MIEEVSLRNFISHSSTIIKLEPGVNIFIGRNGAGKSSVIDGITYALFGKHTRSSNKNIVRWGTQSGAVSVKFSIGNKRFLAERRFNSNGALESAVLKELGEVERTIIAGERRQFGESMSEWVQSIIGLSYEELKVASIIPQGEIQSIIEYEPRELKVLINKIIGLERLESAFNLMGELINSFRMNLRNKYGYDDSDITRIESEIFENKRKIEEVNKKLENSKAEIKRLKEREEEIKKRLMILEPLKVMKQQAESKKLTLIKYIQDSRAKMSEEVRRLEGIISRARQYISKAQEVTSINAEIEGLKAEKTKKESQFNQINEEIGKLRERIEISKKLEFKDNICPLCGSKVNKISNVFDKDLMIEHLNELDGKRNELSRELKTLQERIQKLEGDRNDALFAISWLNEYKISKIDDIERLEKDKKEIEHKLSKLPNEFSSTAIDELVIDEFSRTLRSEISQLIEDSKEFNEAEYSSLISELDNQVEPELRRKLQEEGRYQNEIERSAELISKLELIHKELNQASQYLKLYEYIRSNILSRDGPLPLSLRSWALREIQDKASEYVREFGIGISRIELKEAKHEVSIECYGSRGVIDLQSMSGGEKIAVALALRFAIANLMGKGKLDFIVLDEPTANLDHERRRSLVSLINQFNSRQDRTALNQIIIITHDEDVFGESEVNSIFKFQNSGSGTVVTKLNA